MDLVSQAAIYSEDIEIKRLVAIAEKIAPTRAAVLITGERGTGKTLLSRYIHSRSSRSSKPLIFASLENVSDDDILSYFFHRSRGLLARAEGGTLLIKSIETMNIKAQVEFYERVFVNPQYDVRIIAATNTDLRSHVRLRRFNEELHYKLSVIPLVVPPLRSRPCDIVLLSRLFLDIYAIKNGVCGKTLSASAIDKLISWPWSGNVSELEAVIERSTLLARESVVAADDIQFSEQPHDSLGHGFSAGMTISEAEKCLIFKTLEYTHNNKTQAAQMLGISIRTLRNKLQEYRGGLREQFV